jgi:hypothetical protein
MKQSKKSKSQTILGDIQDKGARRLLFLDFPGMTDELETRGLKDYTTT